MKVNFQQSDAVIEPFALIVAPHRSAEINQAIHILEEISSDTSDSSSENYLDMISGTFGSQSSIIPVKSIAYFYALNKKVYARYAKQDWHINLTLKALNYQLDSSLFVRISNNAIVNMQAITRFDVNLAGNYIAILRDGSKVKVSARYISKIKARLISRS